ncbi:hypothetical protein FRC07_007532 [Ceratobasidium sp. 392]|nr:hypothetical protein FRC07_007532 [Ceratobasidium sp. 392]
MTVGKFTSVFTGSGSAMTVTGTPTGTATNAGATQTGSATSQKKSSTGLIAGVAGAVGGVILAAVLILLLCWCRRRRRSKRREAARMHEPEDEYKPETNQTSGRYDPVVYQPQPYTYSGAPQIEEHSTRTNTTTPYAPSGVFTSNQSYDLHAGGPPVQYNSVTTHAPQARPLGTVSYYSTSSTGHQSPFSQNAGGGILSTGVGSTAGGTSSPSQWSADRKEPAASLSSESPQGGGQAYPWGMAMSPPPRSMTGTALPPYAPPQGPNRG